MLVRGCFLWLCFHLRRPPFSCLGSDEGTFAYYWTTGGFGGDVFGTPFRLDSPSPLNLVNELYSFVPANFTANDPVFDPSGTPSCASLEYVGQEGEEALPPKARALARARFLMNHMDARGIHFTEALIAAATL